MIIFVILLYILVYKIFVIFLDLRKQIFTEFVNTDECQKLILAKYFITIRKNKSSLEVFIGLIRKKNTRKVQSIKGFQSLYYGVYKKGSSLFVFCFC